MNYSNFLSEITSTIQSKLSPNEQVSLQQISKNNGVVLDAICIYSKNVCCFSPLIYMDDWYHQYCMGNSIEEIAEKILKLSKQNFPLSLSSVQSLMSLPAMRSHLILKLINAKQNVDLLKIVPHQPFLDLVLVCSILIETCQHHFATILVTQNHLDTWKISAEELFSIATENVLTQYPPVLRPLTEAMEELSAEHSLLLPHTDQPAPPMYILSNSILYFGAAALTCGNEIQTLADNLEQDLYLLPSSIHEWIVLPATPEFDWNMLTNLVQEVNSVELDPTEYLSNHAYYYSRLEKQILTGLSQ
ncbi:MAG: DUF5688 family protein [Lachnospiraceae bacterium]